MSSASNKRAAALVAAALAATALVATALVAAGWWTGAPRPAAQVLRGGAMQPPHHIEVEAHSGVETHSGVEAAPRSAAVRFDASGAGGATAPAAGEGPASGAQDDVLRVCADANNMPFSNARGEGFENRLAALLAADLGRRLVYHFWPQRRGFLRHTLDAGACDVVMGVPARYARTATTAPYYRSTYVFVTRRTDAMRLAGLDDVRLRRLRVGVHVMGGDFAGVPPALALARRGMVDNLRGFPITGDISRPDPPRALLDALTRGEIDVAVAWGPLAGWFARHARPALETTPVPDAVDGMPMSFSIAAGVRRGDLRLRAEIDRSLARRRTEIARLLKAYGVPRAGQDAAGVAGAADKPFTVAEPAGSRSTSGGRARIAQGGHAG